MNSLDLNALLIIFIVALGTYSLRVSGLLLSSKFVKEEGDLKLFLDYLPSTLLLALVVPSILKEGVIGLIAAFLIFLCMYKTKSILLSLIVGVFTIAIYRNFFI
ncbi:AzlD domain-containing protein [Arcobacter sp. YIC-80]|uniref:AzlD domain-containing protein n=1 Tax=unclassified Arcobacter TaxID=2593671 RepID=UPI00384D60B8